MVPQKFYQSPTQEIQQTKKKCVQQYIMWPGHDPFDTVTKSSSPLCETVADRATPSVCVALLPSSNRVERNTSQEEKEDKQPSCVYVCFSLGFFSPPLPDARTRTRIRLFPASFPDDTPIRASKASASLQRSAPTPEHIDGSVCGHRSTERKYTAASPGQNPDQVSGHT